MAPKTLSAIQKTQIQKNRPERLAGLLLDQGVQDLLFERHADAGAEVTHG